MARKKTFTSETSEKDFSDFYKKLGGSSWNPSSDGTQITDYLTYDNGQGVPYEENKFKAQSKHNRKPILGFFYSLSNSGITEYWPLHLGKNIIGSNPENCDVYLPEATVSAEHASIVIQKKKNPKEVVAYLKDEGSTNGTMLNGESVGIDLQACKLGDKIIFGDHYELLLLLLDPDKLGLGAVEDFIPVKAETEPDFPPTGPMPEEDGTVGIDGNGNMFPTGGTVSI